MKTGMALVLLVFLILAPACGTDRTRIATPEGKEKAALLTAQAKVFWNAGRPEEALALAEEALDENPACLEAVEVGADSLLELARVQEAFALLLKPPPPGAGPGWREACLRRAARLALKMNQPSLAAVHLERALEAHPDDAGLLTVLGEARLKNGQERAASESFQRALLQGGERARILPPFAEAQYRLKEYKKAEALLSELDETGEPMTPRNLMLMGMIQCGLKKPAEGLEWFRRAAAAAHDMPEAPYNQGLALEAMGEEGAAEAAYRKALAIRPGFGPASFQLGRLLVREGQKEEGLALIDQALEAERDPFIRRAMENTRDRLAAEPGGGGAAERGT